MTKQARDIEWLVHWAVAVEAVTAPDPDEARLRGRSTTNSARVASFGELGGMLIDGGRHHPGARSDLDAVEIWGAVLTLPELQRQAVAAHARTMTRPDPRLGEAPRLGPLLDHNDRPRLSPAWDRNRNRLPQYCHVRVECSAAEINAARRFYAAWVDGLATVAGHFRSHPHRLARWTVTGPKAPARPADPWEVPELAIADTMPASAFPELAARGAVHPINRSGLVLDPKQ